MGNSQIRSRAGCVRGCDASARRGVCSASVGGAARHAVKTRSPPRSAAGGRSLPTQPIHRPARTTCALTTPSVLASLQH
ncbi:unnamed protein product [Arctia plantaginis]|uniref:Uncharacterized protein n=1 Tax=Arctia plantaginis TaxID=874455 RepID=A0A8S1A7Z5_ARCPL|nr:unnamed protein product [Arctia plantaginis]CAB3240641.1 unnamed protein product [Arctia plantaginis]